MAISEVKYNEVVFDLSYNIINHAKEKTILILHGWGSNKEIMQNAFSPYLKEFKQIYLDMPGFGGSINESNILTTQDYANIVKLFLDNIGADVNIIAGHSFGGKVATLLKPKC